MSTPSAQQDRCTHIGKIVRQVPEEVKVRKLSQEVYDALKMRAKAHGRSLGAEMAIILANAIAIETTSRVGPEAFKSASFDSFWNIVPGRLYHCIKNGREFKIMVLERIDGGGSDWSFEIETLIAKVPGAATWSRICSASGSVTMASPVIALRAGIDWIARHLGENDQKKSRRSSSGR